MAILAIWKQALHICHTQAISGLEGSPSQDINRLGRSSSLKHDTHNSDKITDLSHDGSEEISSQIQRQFIQEIELAEELAKSIEPGMFFLLGGKKKHTSSLCVFEVLKILKGFHLLGCRKYKNAGCNGDDI